MHMRIAIIFFSMYYLVSIVSILLEDNLSSVSGIIRNCAWITADGENACFTKDLSFSIKILDTSPLLSDNLILPPITFGNVRNKDFN